jgi:hypothetical protein
MSEEPEFFSYTRDEFLDEFVHPDDRPALEEAHQKRVLAVRAEYLTDIRKRAGLTQAEVAEAMGVSRSLGCSRGDAPGPPGNRVRDFRASALATRAPQRRPAGPRLRYQVRGVRHAGGTVRSG